MVRIDSKTKYLSLFTEPLKSEVWNLQSIVWQFSAKMLTVAEVPPYLTILALLIQYKDRKEFVKSNGKIFCMYKIIASITPLWQYEGAYDFI